MPDIFYMGPGARSRRNLGHNKGVFGFDTYTVSFITGLSSKGFQSELECT